MKAIDLLVNSVLPPDMQRDSFDLSAKGVKSLLSELAMTHKDEYADIIDKLKNIGRNLVYQQGATITLNDLKAPFDRQKVYDEMDDKVKLIKATVKDKKEQKKLIKQTYQEYSSLLDNLTKQFTSDSPNGLSRIVQSGARGNLTQQKAIVTSPSVYVDYKGDTIPIFVRKSFAEGLSLPEYLAGTYGGRAAVIEGKKNTAKFGGLGKEMANLGVQQVVTSLKDDSNNFIDLDADDISAYGRVLAKDTSGYPRGTLIDKNVLAKLRGAGNKTLYVYSPLSTVSEEGIPAEAVGISYNGTLPGMGYQAGITAAQSLGEILAQSSLNCLMVGTKVKMADGTLKPIESIKVGDIVLGSDKEGNKFPVKVKSLFNQGKQHCYRVRINGVEVSCTLNHKFLNNGKVEPILEIVQK